MKWFNLGSCALVFLLVACAEEEPATSGPADDAAVTGDVSADVPVDATDNADSLESDTSDPEDSGGEPSFDPLALVFEKNPVESPERTEVTLQHLTSDDHTLKGEFANVVGCAQDLDAGRKESLNFGGFALDITFCAPSHTALPGEDGTYRHLGPPAEPGVNDDSFAELMMYHHMQRVHDYFKATHGMTDLDYPLDALVNVSVHTGLCDDWAAFGNALFTPLGSFEYGVNFDFGFDGPAIIFGQTQDKDFAYSADVIYHEYTHAMVGATRLQGAFVDDRGVNLQPGALNEAYADYFACTLSGDPIIGSYALNDVAGLTLCGVPVFGGGNNARDLASGRRCPDDLAGEVHVDGVIFGSALWAIREALGAETADAVIAGALADFTATTDFELAAAATLAEAQETLTAEQATQVETILTERGVLACDRRVPPAKVGAHGPLPVYSPAETGGALGFGLPVIQLALDVPADATTFTLTVTGNADSLDLAIKPGADPIRYAAGGAGHDAFRVLPFQKVDGVWQITVGGSCLSAGDWTLALHNTGGGFSISSMAVEFSTELPAEPNFQCGG